MFDLSNLVFATLPQAARRKKRHQQ